MHCRGEHEHCIRYIMGVEMQHHGYYAHFDQSGIMKGDTQTIALFWREKGRCFRLDREREREREREMREREREREREELGDKL